MALNSSDKKSLEIIHRLFLELEIQSSDQSFDVSQLTHLKKEIKKLYHSENSDVIRLSTLEEHLTSDMSLKHFSSFAIPFERLLNKNLRDDEFLIYSQDLEMIPHKENDQALPLIFILDNIRSAFNVGSIFRTAECLNIQKIYLCGYTATPDQEKIEKTAMGTHKWVPWDYHFKTIELIEKIKNNFHVIAMETTNHARSIYEPMTYQQPTAIVFGNERFGLDPLLISACHEVRAIPHRGQKNSLNVGVCAAIIGYEWFRQSNSNELRK